MENFFEQIIIAKVLTYQFKINVKLHSFYLRILICLLMKQFGQWLESHWNRGFTSKLRILAAIVAQFSFRETFDSLV